MNYCINTELLSNKIKDRLFTPHGFAKACGQDAVTVRNILSGKSKTPRIDTVIRMCNILKVQDIREIIIEN